MTRWATRPSDARRRISLISALVVLALKTPVDRILEPRRYIRIANVSPKARSPEGVIVSERLCFLGSTPS